MDRNTYIHQYIDPHSKGLEIGPGPYPVAAKRQGFDTTVIDCVETSELIEKFKVIGADTSTIEDVDLVWRGESYAELTGARSSFDWVIASHVIEHTPDLIGFVNDVQSVLKPSGKLILVIPDMRFCFDCRRMPTGIAEIVDAHYAKSQRHSPGNVADFFLNHTLKKGSAAWDQEHYGELEFSFSPEQAKQRMNRVVKTDVKFDVHAWRFLPSSFRLLIQDLFALQLFELQEAGFRDTQGHEFICILSKQKAAKLKPRNELLIAVHEEMTKGIEHIHTIQQPEPKGFLDRLKRMWK